MEFGLPRLTALLGKIRTPRENVGSGEWIAQRRGAKTLVIFVHGIGGHATSSWGRFPTLISTDAALECVDVYCWAYPTSFIRRTPSVWMSARQLFTEVRLRFGNYARIVLVGHSLGGLVIRAMVLQALKNAKADSLTNIDHILTFGTPNDGSELAMAANRMGLANSQLEALDLSGQVVAQIRNDWINLVYAPKIAPGEQLIKRRIPLTTVAGLEDNIVSPSSVLSYFADPPAEVVPGDHVTMKEPSGEQSTCYLLLKRVLLQESGPSVSAPKAMLKDADISAEEWLYLALLEDQFASGVWGGSLENTGVFYGKGQDVGSISVSVKCCHAMLAATGFSPNESITRFREYLLQHRSERGAFGMLRTVGSSAFPVVEILENSRHTAAAITFFHQFDGPEHPYLSLAVKFLLDGKNQTPSGLWVDVGPRDEERVDPLTVSHVIGALEDLRLDSQAVHFEPAALTENIDRGLDYLFAGAYRTEEGYWLYRFANEAERKRQLENVYRYTAGILSCVAKAVVRRPEYAEDVIQMARSLGRICERYNGLPDSPARTGAGLSATINLYSVCTRFAELSNLTEKLSEHAGKLIRSSSTLVAGNASGWASALEFLADSRPALDLRRCTGLAIKLREHSLEFGSTGGCIDALRAVARRRQQLEISTE